MNKSYKESRELGRSVSVKVENNTDSELDISVDKLENGNTDIKITSDEDPQELSVNAKFYWLDNYHGEASEFCVIKSDLYDQVTKLERITNRQIVGFSIMDDGTVMCFIEDNEKEG